MKFNSEAYNDLFHPETSEAAAPTQGGGIKKPDAKKKSEDNKPDEPDEPDEPDTSEPEPEEPDEPEEDGGEENGADG